jgi:uncharacterized membrane protein YtjA (UPF0391 family)
MERTCLLDYKERDSGMTPRERRPQMLRWVLMFLVLALLAGALGFSGVAIASAGIARILFFIFLVFFLLSLVGHLSRRT